MKLALSALLLSSAFALPLFAQTPPAPDAPPPPPPPGMHHGGPHGPGMFGPGMEARRAETIANSPFTAKFTATSSFTTREGKQQERSSTSMLYRDSQGRVREETTVPPPPPRPAATEAAAAAPVAPATPRAPRTMIVILDPVAHTITRLNSDRKTAVVQTVPADFFTRMQARDERLAKAATADASSTERPRGDRATTTDLGNKVIAGVPVAGKRVVRTAPAHDGEAARTMTHEVWFSPDAKFEVSSSETSDRMSHTSTLTSFSKAEPDAALFQVPAGYTTEAAQEHGFGPHHGGRRGPGGPVGPEGAAGPDAPPPPPAPGM